MLQQTSHSNDSRTLFWTYKRGTLLITRKALHPFPPSHIFSQRAADPAEEETQASQGSGPAEAACSPTPTLQYFTGQYAVQATGTDDFAARASITAI